MGSGDLNGSLSPAKVANTCFSDGRSPSHQAGRELDLPREVCPSQQACSAEVQVAEIGKADQLDLQDKVGAQRTLCRYFYQDKKARGLNKEKVKSGDWTSLSEEVASSTFKVQNMEGYDEGGVSKV